MQKPIDEFKNRFNKILSLKDVKPVELAEKTGLSKSTISHYMSGYTKPKSDRLYMLAKTLNVNEAWLMGYDVPMERDTYEDQNIITFDAILDRVMDIFENTKYKVSLSDDFDCDIIIKDQGHKILACMKDFDLVARHESLRKAGKEITAEALLKISTNNFTSAEKTLIEKYRILDLHGKDMVNTVLNKESERMKELENEPLSNITPMRTKPYYQHMASAGSGEYLFDHIPTDQIDVEDTPLSQKADFVLGVNGHSMEPTYNDGDNVLVRKTSDVPIGHIGVFIKGSHCYIKELGEDRLISHNEDKETYPDIYPDDVPIRVVGAVLGKV